MADNTHSLSFYLAYLPDHLPYRTHEMLNIHGASPVILSMTV